MLHLYGGGPLDAWVRMPSKVNRVEFRGFSVA
jgi:hypothetical protein